MKLFKCLERCALNPGVNEAVMSETYFLERLRESQELIWQVVRSPHLNLL